jgi:hypothetical protein
MGPQDGDLRHQVVTITDGEDAAVGGVGRVCALDLSPCVTSIDSLSQESSVDQLIWPGTQSTVTASRSPQHESLLAAFATL